MTGVQRSRCTTCSARTPTTSAWTAAPRRSPATWRGCGSTSSRAASSRTRRSASSARVRRQRHGLPVARRRGQRALRGRLQVDPADTAGASTRTSWARAWGGWDHGGNLNPGGLFGASRLSLANNWTMDGQRHPINPAIVRQPADARRPAGAVAARRQRGLVRRDRPRGSGGCTRSSLEGWQRPGDELLLERGLGGGGVEAGPELLARGRARAASATWTTRSTCGTVAATGGEVPDDFGGFHYVFARLDQTTVAATIRLNVSLTPNLSLQTYLQPLISAGRYTDFKELARSRSYDFIHYASAAEAPGDPDEPPTRPSTSSRCAGTPCCAGSTGRARCSTSCGRRSGGLRAAGRAALRSLDAAAVRRRGGRRLHGEGHLLPRPLMRTGGGVRRRPRPAGRRGWPGAARGATRPEPASSMEARDPAAAGEARDRAGPHPNRRPVMRYLRLLSLSLVVTAGLVAAGGPAAAYPAPTGPGDCAAAGARRAARLPRRRWTACWTSRRGRARRALSRFIQPEPFEGAGRHREHVGVVRLRRARALRRRPHVGRAPRLDRRAALPPRQLRRHRLRRRDARPVPRPPHRLRVRHHPVRLAHGRHRRTTTARRTSPGTACGRPASAGTQPAAGPARCASRSRSCASRRAIGRSGA